ncbi:MAG: S8 family serine peptidase [Lachnospiraceae bacterium]|nr:S8 family serine peptidase [Lachnospiraceae bacterium]
MSYYIENGDFESGKIIVALDKNIDYASATSFYNSQIFAGIDVEKITIIYQPGKLSSQSDFGYLLLAELANKDKMATIDAAEKISAKPYVVYTELDYSYEMYVLPNDPDFRYLWGLETINAPAAWNFTTGSRDVVVGVVDSGIDHQHPDIKQNMWHSFDRSYENGWDFVNDNPNSMDLSGHGTHVAGTIGAVGNNAIGITGVCWNIQVAAFRIGSVTMSLAAAIAAIDFANKMGIPILNNSWGGRFYSSSLKYAIEQYNGLFIVAAGNSSKNNDYIPDYPSSFDSENIISVAATDRNNNLASFSNYGIRTVDIAAPGRDILSLSPRGGYDYKNGTSMAAPHVAGAAALLKANWPALKTMELKEIILESVDRKSSLTGRIKTGGILNTSLMFEVAKDKIEKIEKDETKFCA